MVFVCVFFLLGGGGLITKLCGFFPLLLIRSFSVSFLLSFLLFCVFSFYICALFSFFLLFSSVFLYILFAFFLSVSCFASINDGPFTLCTLKKKKSSLK